jgi:hypothetical protein
MKPILLATALFSLAVSTLAAACGDADQSQLGIGSRTNTTLPDGTPAEGTPEGGAEGEDAAAPADASAADGSGTDAGAKDAAGDAADAATAITAFTGAGAYVATTGPSTIKGAHGGNGNPSKLACQGCHGAGGGAPRFFAGGSVFKDAAGTMPAAQVEVRFRDAAGKSVSAFTDATGSFYVRQSTATAAGIALPALVGARDAAATKLMSATIANGDCNSSACHGGAQGRVHVP